MLTTIEKELVQLQEMLNTKNNKDLLSTHIKQNLASVDSFYKVNCLANFEGVPNFTDLLNGQLIQHNEMSSVTHLSIDKLTDTDTIIGLLNEELLVSIIKHSGNTFISCYDKDIKMMIQCSDYMTNNQHLLFNEQSNLSITSINRVFWVDNSQVSILLNQYMNAEAFVYDYYDKKPTKVTHYSFMNSTVNYDAEYNISYDDSGTVNQVTESNGCIIYPEQDTFEIDKELLRYIFDYINLDSGMLETKTLSPAQQHYEQQERVLESIYAIYSIDKNPALLEVIKTTHHVKCEHWNDLIQLLIQVENIIQDSQ